MCGRYAVRQDPAALAEEFDAVDRTDGSVEPDFNVTPTKTVPIVVQRGAERSVRPVRWGFVPPWAKEVGSGPPMINARAETITSKPVYAESAARRRCLVPATGWYEWQPGDRRRQPYLCTRGDGASLAMAAVFTAWWPPNPTDPPLVSCAVVTTDAVGEFADIHHRMPLVLSEDRWADWLDPQRTEITELLKPSDRALAELEIRPVSSEVNSMRNNRPELLDRVEPAPEPAEQVALFES
ncbi:SOS response-associated peptidase [Saccharopolyspora rosea]|uniref:Abasic site processing protein n=1 Tax=Saccharopolyspora rosea TaxID=524884 RepID=A0ABW3G3S0_9PSEU|nr:SOS response-associated peptidase [Saccharopolyspora rosea]